MLCDLKCELLVTLGDAKIDTEKEKILMEKHNEWENYKVKFCTEVNLWHC